MSEEHIEKVTCSKCGKESEFLVHDIISTDDSPGMKAKVREGNLFDWKCPHCGAESTLMYPMLYHQPEDKLMIYLMEPDSNDNIEAPEGYTCRVTKDVNAFLEKLAIFDEGLDDRVVELMKLFIVAAMQVERPQIVITDFLFDRDSDGLRFFTVVTGDGDISNAAFSDEAYEGVKDLLAKYPAPESIRIDAQWAVEAAGIMNMGSIK